MGNSYHVDVNHVAGPRSPGQRADLVRLVAGKGNNFTATQKPAQLDLSA